MWVQKVFLRESCKGRVFVDPSYFSTIRQYDCSKKKGSKETYPTGSASNVVNTKRSHLCPRFMTGTRALIISYPSALGDQRCKIDILNGEREDTDIDSYPYVVDDGAIYNGESDLNVLEPSWFESCRLPGFVVVHQDNLGGIMNKRQGRTRRAFACPSSIAIDLSVH